MQNNPLKIDHLLDQMWGDYCRINPHAVKIYEALSHRGERVVNDHIALRTFRHPAFGGIGQLEKVFLDLGYTPKGEYHFKEKKLFAKHYELQPPHFPKIFISEMILDEASLFLKEQVDCWGQSLTDVIKNQENFSYSGRPWDLSYKDYLILSKESEYAAWVGAHGFRPNHFTVLVNELQQFQSLSELNQFLKNLGFILNTSGGEIKGSSDQKLEQSSIMANEIQVRFADGAYEVPGCYYEFAKRYPIETSNPQSPLYQGFIASSADRIFESTHRRV